MVPISSIIRFAIRPQVKTTLCAFRCATSLSDICGGSRSGGKKCSGDTGNKDKDDKPCLLGPSGGSDNPGAPTMYDSRKLGHKLSTSNVTPCFETLANIPTGVFRCTTGEVLGRGAAKCSYYQNPEYFSYHHMSFYDFNIALRQYRKACAKTGRKPV